MLKSRNRDRAVRVCIVCTLACGDVIFVFVSCFLRPHLQRQVVEFQDVNDRALTAANLAIIPNTLSEPYTDCDRPSQSKLALAAHTLLTSFERP